MCRDVRGQGVLSVLFLHLLFCGDEVGKERTELEEVGDSSNLSPLYLNLDSTPGAANSLVRLSPIWLIKWLTHPSGGQMSE